MVKAIGWVSFVEQATWDHDKFSQLLLRSVSLFLSELATRKLVWIDVSVYFSQLLIMWKQPQESKAWLLFRTASFQKDSSSFYTWVHANDKLVKWREHRDTKALKFMLKPWREQLNFPNRKTLTFFYIIVKMFIWFSLLYGDSLRNTKGEICNIYSLLCMWKSPTCYHFRFFSYIFFQSFFS